MIITDELVIKIGNKFHIVHNLLQAKSALTTLYEELREVRCFGEKHTTELWEISGAYSMESDKSLLTPINRLKAEKVAKVVTSDFIHFISKSAVSDVCTKELFTLDTKICIREFLKREGDLTWYMELT